jgi:flagellar hook-basal body complex protein FliE
MTAPIHSEFRPIAGIEPVEGLPGDLAASAAPAQAGGQPGPFAQALADAIGRVEDYRVQADHAVNRFLRGDDEELHKVAMATQQAELSFDLFLQVKNKVVQAYQEVMRMQL